MQRSVKRRRQKSKRETFHSPLILVFYTMSQTKYLPVASKIIFLIYLFIRHRKNFPPKCLFTLHIIGNSLLNERGNFNQINNCMKPLLLVFILIITHKRCYDKKHSLTVTPSFQRLHRNNHFRHVYNDQSGFSKKIPYKKCRYCIYFIFLTE